MDQVLKGIRVLDFGRFIAAPWCAALLADMGADVIRIERREGGEDRWVLPVADSGEGGTFLQSNRNKRSMTLDTTTPDGAAIVKKLVATADIVTVNMPEQSLRTNGLDYESLRAIKADIIVASASAFGNGGPYSDRIGYDGIGQVMGGAVYRSGSKEKPARCIVPYADFGAAMLLAFGVMTALYHRRATGEGQLIETSLLAASLMMMDCYYIEEGVQQLDRGPQGNRAVGSSPADLFRCKDGWVLLQVAGQPMFKRWCRLVGKEDWFTDPRFANDILRGNNGDILNDFMQDWCSEKTKAEVLAALDAAKLPGAAMLTPLETLADPHVQAMGYLKPVAFPGTKRPAPIIETPIRMSKTPGSIRMRPPLLGEHTDELMKELGYDDRAISDFRARAVI